MKIGSIMESMLLGHNLTQNNLKAIIEMNQSTIDATIGYSTNPSTTQAQYDSAILLSASQIEGFARFSDSYLENAFRLFDGQSTGRHSHSEGMMENVSDKLSDRLCIQLLSRTDLSDEIKNRCKGAKIVSGATVVKFDSYANLPHPQRSCAYYNFTSQEQRAQEALRH